jgi:hypothetical protein
MPDSPFSLQLPGGELFANAAASVVGAAIDQLDEASKHQLYEHPTAHLEIVTHGRGPIEQRVARVVQALRDADALLQTEPIGGGRGPTPPGQQEAAGASPRRLTKYVYRLRADHDQRLGWPDDSTAGALVGRHVKRLPARRSADGGGRRRRGGTRARRTVHTRGGDRRRSRMRTGHLCSASDRASRRSAGLRRGSARRYRRRRSAGTRSGRRRSRAARRRSRRARPCRPATSRSAQSPNRRVVTACELGRRPGRRRTSARRAHIR